MRAEPLVDHRYDLDLVVSRGQGEWVYHRLADVTIVDVDLIRLEVTVDLAEGQFPRRLTIHERHVLAVVPSRRAQHPSQRQP